MEKKNTLGIYDTTLNVWTADRDDAEPYTRIRRLLRGAGFSFHQNPKIKKHWPSLASTHHAGSRKDVHFVSDISPVGCQFEFYEDVVRDNRNGGLYHFDKIRKMPYLRQLRVRTTLHAIVDCLVNRGFQDTTRYQGDDAYRKMREYRGEMEGFHGKAFYERPVAKYNSEDADGRFLSDGELRYFRTSNGHLGRGTVYHNINNMWWVLPDRFTLDNICASSLFTYVPGIHKRKDHPDPGRSMQAQLARYVRDQNFERAIGLRDALKRSAAKAS